MTAGWHNLFLALQPDAEAIAGIGRLYTERRFGGTPIIPSCLHVSLMSLGEHAELPHEAIERATAALASVTMTQFAVALNHLVGWKGRSGAKPLVLLGDEGVAGIDLLLAQIRPALATLGFKRQQARESIPHLTLAYSSQTFPEEVVTPIRWTVREFVLIDSLVGQRRHVVLNRWPLASVGATLSDAPSSP